MLPNLKAYTERFKVCVHFNTGIVDLKWKKLKCHLKVDFQLINTCMSTINYAGISRDMLLQKPIYQESII